MHIFYIVLLSFSAALFTWLGTWFVRQVMQYLAIVDLPDERRNHKIPTPRGGGIAVIFFAIMFMIVASADSHFLGAAFFLAILCLVDDVRGVSVRLRFLIQALLVAWMMWALPGQVFQGILPLWADKLASGVILLGFLNLYNFMDGIDEITSIETFSIALGITAVYALSETLHIGVVADAWIITGAVFGFWYWNRHPAQIFLGDSGSVPLGFMMGTLLLILASRGFWQAALIIPSYYFVDGGVTLLRRVLRREKIWQAHSEHAYQKAVRAGWSHKDVTSHIFVLNLLLAILAGATAMGTGLGWVMLATGYLLSLMLYFYFLSGKPAPGALQHAHPAP